MGGTAALRSSTEPAFMICLKDDFELQVLKFSAPNSCYHIWGQKPTKLDRTGDGQRPHKVSDFQAVATTRSIAFAGATAVMRSDMVALKAMPSLVWATIWIAA